MPYGVFGALVATYFRGLMNDALFSDSPDPHHRPRGQERHLDRRVRGRRLARRPQSDVAAMFAARVRFRPIIMTSLAFILGVVPLAISTGAGANSRHAIGTAVIGGMLGATFLATFSCAYFFKAITSIAPEKSGAGKIQNADKPADDEELEEV